MQNESSRLTYFDYASLVPPAVEAIDAMRVAAETAWGQPGSLHAIGGRALYAMDMARRQVADFLAATPQEIVFTGSGRDALVLGMEHALARMAKGGVIVSSRLEHPSVQRLVDDAARAGHEVRWLSLPEGVPSEEDRRVLGTAALVVLSACNHELGTTLLPVIEGVPESAVRVIDAVQAAPWMSLETLNDDRTFYSISGAKLGAPMSIGALRVPSSVYYKARESSRPLEGESPPWLMAIGLGAACEARASGRDAALASARARATELLDGLRALEPDLLVNGAADARLGCILNVSFPGRFGKSLVSALSLEGVCISHTAACQARLTDVSPVVRAAYPSAPDRAAGATRWSMSERVTSEEITRALEAMRRILSVDRRRA